MVAVTGLVWLGGAGIGNPLLYFRMDHWHPRYTLLAFLLFGIGALSPISLYALHTQATG